MNTLGVEHDLLDSDESLSSSDGESLAELEGYSICKPVVNKKIIFFSINSFVIHDWSIQ